MRERVLHAARKEACGVPATDKRLCHDRLKIAM